MAVLFRNISGLGLAISGHGYMVGLACRVICRVRGDRRPASLSEVTLPGRAAEAVAGLGAGSGQTGPSEPRPSLVIVNPEHTQPVMTLRHSRSPFLRAMGPCQLCLACPSSSDMSAPHLI